MESIVCGAHNKTCSKINLEMEPMDENVCNLVGGMHRKFWKAKENWDDATTQWAGAVIAKSCTKTDKVHNKTEYGKKVWISLSMYEVTGVLLRYNRSKELVHVNQFKKPSPAMFTSNTNLTKFEDVDTENELGTNGVESLVIVGSVCCRSVIQQVKKVGSKVNHSQEPSPIMFKVNIIRKKMRKCQLVKWKSS